MAHLLVTEELFSKAIQNTKRNRKDLAKRLVRMSPDLLDIWHALHPTTSASEARPRDFKRFAKTAIQSFAFDKTAEEAIIEFIKSIGSVRGYPAIRRVAVNIDNQRSITA